MKYKINHEVPKEESKVATNYFALPKILALATVTSGGLMLGTVLAWSSPAIPNLHKSGDMGILSDDVKSWIGSLVTVGALIGAPCAGYSIEKFGRKISLLATAIPFIVGWLSIAFSYEVIVLCSGRLLTGFGVGALSLAAPVYISEISDDQIRGTLGAAFQLMVSLGLLFTYVMGSVVSWNTMAIIFCVIPVVFLAVMSFMMESPRYYLSKGLYPEANRSLSWFRGTDYKNPTKEILQELENGQNSIERARSEGASYKDLLKLSIVKPVVVILILMFFNQFCGVNAVAFHTTEIFEKSATGIDSKISTIIVGVVQVLATLVASVLVDRIGRRILLLVSFVTMAFSLAFLGLFFLLQKNDSVESSVISWLPLSSVVAFNIGYSIGLGPLVWTVMSELLPANVIGLASAVATTFNWSLAFIVTRFFRDMLKTLGIEWCFWMFSISCAVGALFVFALVPETKGKSLDEIQQHFISAPSNTRPNKTESKTELV